MRLNKYIARSRGVSRRVADGLVESGEITINGQPAELGTQVGDGDRVEHKGQVLELKPFKYLLLNKPLGYVCSRKPQGDKPSVYELVPEDSRHLQIAGRLDADSSGLLLLTNDGDFALHLTHPRYQKRKAYSVELDKPLLKKHQAAIENGVELDDGVSILGLKGSGNTWKVTMHEGRNRQIRRTFAALGYEVTGLNREEMGPYNLANLEVGGYAETDKKEV